eukprot:141091-Lingulodinium_polyedra.AAC.1
MDYAWLCVGYAGTIRGYAWVVHVYAKPTHGYAWGMHGYAWFYMVMHGHASVCVTARASACLRVVLRTGYARATHGLRMGHACSRMATRGYAWVTQGLCVVMHGIRKLMDAYACFCMPTHGLRMAYAWLTH